MKNHTTPTELNEIFCSDTQLAKRYETSRATIWRWTSKQKFPSPVKLSHGCTRWKMSEVLAWERGVTADNIAAQQNGGDAA